MLLALPDLNNTDSDAEVGCGVLTEGRTPNEMALSTSPVFIVLSLSRSDTECSQVEHSSPPVVIASSRR